MRISNSAVVATFAIALATAPFGLSPDHNSLSEKTALAKDNGGGNGGGNGRSAETREAKSAERGKSSGKAGERGKTGNFFTDAFATLTGKGQKSSKAQSVERRQGRTETKSATRQPLEPITTLASVPKMKPAVGPLRAELAGLNSLNRNYRAYLNSSDPRMSAIRNYVTAYATYELASGIDTVPTDAALDDEALRAALQAAAKPGAVVDDATLDWAKELLGVGPAVGKIDEIRKELAAAMPVEPVVDPVLDPVVDPVTDPARDPADQIVTAPDPLAPTSADDVVLPTDTTDTASVTP